MLFFSTITVPTVVSASQLGAPMQEERQYNHSWQRNFMRSMFAAPQELVVPQEYKVSDPSPLRRQMQPTYRISLRRRVTDTLNSPFDYQMTEAARVVL